MALRNAVLIFRLEDFDAINDAFRNFGSSPFEFEMLKSSLSSTFGEGKWKTSFKQSRMRKTHTYGKSSEQISAKTKEEAISFGNILIGAFIQCQHLIAQKLYVLIEKHRQERRDVNLVTRWTSSPVPVSATRKLSLSDLEVE